MAAPAPAPFPDSHNDESLLRSGHALACAISWGILVPMLVYRENFLPSPLPRSHILLKAALYAIAAAATAIGFWASAISHGGIANHKAHFGIAIALLAMAFLHLVGVKHRVWGIEIFGLIVMVLAITDVFGGFGILRPHRVWRIAYVSIIATLIAIVGCSMCCLYCCFQGGVLCFFTFRRHVQAEDDF
ncbi:cytochrome b561 and DOMON domain-containing protein At3g59070-like [Selaginella moellendorffii]|uniref:cytochrome b561 and DOMON domain-containing protein At3g59070-like n=1 Tax=Selaginella moellendorffii TaxID=88036 RepID=UPI000D1D0A58|nr:cytochrome b561 and DOMON domain-containing protein At3g59070-like [Selaginella moellendorffii]|eukprot:XP_024525128.1 cytochrome b561 and DOMON domain-containing protein At3g59070-like [Selaginella moellendorffii]